MANNLGGSAAAHRLRHLLASIRAVAPAAAITFVNWSTSRAPSPRRIAAQPIEAVARSDAADVVRAGEVLAALHATQGVGERALYARYGRDKVRPV